MKPFSGPAPRFAIWRIRSGTPYWLRVTEYGYKQSVEGSQGFYNKLFADRWYPDV